mmetsp:Transcript_129964/g.296333  ORF Transcript_129964/g.296333 Transcript_129964/m.296333 type:complete len:661 (+) Transcript_129964:76-2058(+)
MVGTLQRRPLLPPLLSMDFQKGADSLFRPLDTQQWDLSPPSVGGGSTSVISSLRRQSRTTGPSQATSIVRELYLAPSSIGLDTIEDVSSECGSVAASRSSRSSSLARGGYSQSVAARSSSAASTLRTGEDAIRFFAKYGGSSSVKFVYCNLSQEEGAGPYDLVVVPENKVASEHFVISVRGVVHSKPGGGTDYIPLHVWKHHSWAYGLLRRVRFFRMFPQAKALMRWRSGARYQAYCDKRERLAKNCFFTRPRVVGKIAEGHALASAVRGILFTDNIGGRVTDLDEFALGQKKAVAGGIAQVEHVLELVRGCMDVLVSEHKKAIEHAAKGVGEAKARSMVQEKQQVRDRARRTQLATLHLEELGGVVRLLDCMVGAQLVKAVRGCLERFNATLDSGPGERVFVVPVELDGQEVHLCPSVRRLVPVVAKLGAELNEKLHGLSWLSGDGRYQRSFRVGPAPGVTAMDYSRLVPRSFEGVTRRIQKDAEAAKGWAEKFYCDFIHEPVQVTQVSGYQIISKLEEVLRHQETLQTRFRANYRSGCVSLDAHGLHDGLAAGLSCGVVALKQALLREALGRCSAATALVDSVRALNQPAQPAGGCGGYVANFLSVRDYSQDREMDEAVDEVEDLFDALRKYKVRISNDDQLLLTSLQAKVEAYHDGG